MATSQAQTCKYILCLINTIITLKFIDVLDVFLLTEFDGNCFYQSLMIHLQNKLVYIFALAKEIFSM